MVFKVRFATICLGSSWIVTPVPKFIVLVLIYFLLGAGVKYVDAAYDDDTFSKRCASCLAIFLGLIAGIAMIWDQPTLIIFLSLIVGVTITGKLDIRPFQILVVIAVLLPGCYYGTAVPIAGSDWHLVLMLSLGAAIDEIGNDLADAKILKHILRLFFLYRGYLKLLIGLIVVVHYLRLPYALAFMSFDIGYLLLTRASERRVRLGYNSGLLTR